MFGGVEFTEVQRLPLHDARATDAQTFADGVVDVCFAVFGASTAFEKHVGQKNNPAGVGANKEVGRPTDVLTDARAVTQLLAHGKI